MTSLVLQPEIRGHPARPFSPDPFLQVQEESYAHAPQDLYMYLFVERGESCDQ